MTYTAKEFADAMWANGTRTLKPSGGAFPATRIATYTAAIWAEAVRALSDTTGPTVTVNQAASQISPTGISPVHLTAVFSEPVDVITPGVWGVLLTGTAGAITAVVTEIAPLDGTTYDIAVSGMTGPGTVIATIDAGYWMDAATNTNDASTSTDNTITYDISLLSFTGRAVYTQYFSATTTAYSGATMLEALITLREDAHAAAPMDTTCVVKMGSGAHFYVYRHATDWCVKIRVAGGTEQYVLVPVAAEGVNQSLLILYDSTLGSDQFNVYQRVGAATAWTLVGSKTSATAFATGAAEVVYLRGGAVVGNQNSVIDLAYRFSSTSLHTLTQWNEYAANTHTLAQLHGELAFTAYYIFSTPDYAADYMHDRTSAQLDFPAIGSPSSGTAAHMHLDSAGYDSINPTVTINQAAAQADPTSISSILFDVVFSESMTGFATGDVSFTGSTAPGTLVGTVSGSGTTYLVTVTGMTGPGTVIASIAAEKANDAAGNPNVASTSTDHTVTYDVAAPAATVAAANVTETASTYLFNIQWDDPSGMDYTTIAAQANIQIVKVGGGSNGNCLCTAWGWNPNPTGIAAQYTVTLAHAWTAADNGTWNIIHVDETETQVADSLGNKVALGAVLGSFTVTIAAAGSPGKKSRTLMTLAALQAAGVLKL